MSANQSHMTDQQLQQQVAKLLRVLEGQFEKQANPATSNFAKNSAVVENLTYSIRNIQSLQRRNVNEVGKQASNSAEKPAPLSEQLLNHKITTDNEPSAPNTDLFNQKKTQSDTATNAPFAGPVTRSRTQKQESVQNDEQTTPDMSAGS